MRFGKALLDSRRVLSDINLRPGMHVADFGCGKTGHICLPASEIVGQDGRVYAVDIVQPNLGMLKNLSAMRGASNVVTIWGDVETPGRVAIPPRSLDHIFLVNNLSILSSAEGLTHEVRRLLKPTGSLVVIDWKRRFAHPVAPPTTKLLDLHDAELLFARHGFTKIDEIPISRSHWGMVLS